MRKRAAGCVLLETTFKVKVVAEGEEEEEEEETPMGRESKRIEEELI